MKEISLSKKPLALVLALVMALSLIPIFDFAAAEEGYSFWDLRSDASITRSIAGASPVSGTGDATLAGSINGEPLTIARYSRWYAENPNHLNQRMTIYVPSNATAESAVYFIVSNGGWGGTTFNGTRIGNNFNYSVSGSSPSDIALALERGMIIVDCGHRGRNSLADPYNPGQYIHHSPAQVSDVKAGLRFLKYNAEPGMLLEGKFNPDLVFIAGHSGGGGMVALAAASGNSPDYFESLYALGAAGIEYDGVNYTSTVSDRFGGTYGQNPIIDIAMGGQMYEWSHNPVRTLRASNAGNNGNMAPYATNDVLMASAWYANDFVRYLNGITINGEPLKDEFGNRLIATYVHPEDIYDEAYLAENAAAGITGGSFKDAVKRLYERDINKAIQSWVAANPGMTGATTGLVTPSDNYTVSVANLNTYSAWLRINGEIPTAGLPAATDVATITDLDTYLLYQGGASITAQRHAVYVWPEHHSLFSADPRIVQSPGDEWYWNTRGGVGGRIGLGQNWTIDPDPRFDGLYPDWQTYLKTSAGAKLAISMKTNSPIPYLVDAGSIPYLQDAGFYGSTYVEPAPYWYYYHGARDQDVGSSIQALMYYALLQNPKVKDVNFEYRWGVGHSGNQSNNQFFAWLDGVLASVVSTEPTAYVDKLNGNMNNLTITVYETLVSGKIIAYTETLPIRNNAEGTYQVGPYKVFVDTKGNTQIRACYIVE